ncbi:unnamed protein product [Symbiodinium sp. CCMP2456]|nr:unnamed protein product [Symbiodinium sp. CCMP2456]
MLPGNIRSSLQPRWGLFFLKLNAFFAFLLQLILVLLLSLLHFILSSILLVLLVLIVLAGAPFDFLFFRLALPLFFLHFLRVKVLEACLGALVAAFHCSLHHTVSLPLTESICWCLMKAAQHHVQ